MVHVESVSIVLKISLFFFKISFIFRLSISFRASIKEDIINDTYPALTNKLNKYFGSGDTEMETGMLKNEEQPASESLEIVIPSSPGMDSKGSIASPSLLRHLPQELKPLSSGLIQVFDFFPFLIFFSFLFVL